MALSTSALKALIGVGTLGALGANELYNPNSADAISKFNAWKAYKESFDPFVKAAMDQGDLPAQRVASYRSNLAKIAQKFRSTVPQAHLDDVPEVRSYLPSQSSWRSLVGGGKNVEKVKNFPTPVESLDDVNTSVRGYRAFDNDKTTHIGLRSGVNPMAPDDLLPMEERLGTLRHEIGHHVHKQVATPTIRARFLSAFAKAEKDKNFMAKLQDLEDMRGAALTEQITDSSGVTRIVAKPGEVAAELYNVLAELRTFDNLEIKKGSVLHPFKEMMKELNLAFPSTGSLTRDVSIAQRLKVILPAVIGAGAAGGAILGGPEEAHAIPKPPVKKIGETVLKRLTPSSTTEALKGLPFEKGIYSGKTIEKVFRSDRLERTTGKLTRFLQFTDGTFGRINTDDLSSLVKAAGSIKYHQNFLNAMPEDKMRMAIRGTNRKPEFQGVTKERLLMDEVLDILGKKPPPSTVVQLPGGKKIEIFKDYAELLEREDLLGGKIKILGSPTDLVNKYKIPKAKLTNTLGTNK